MLSADMMIAVNLHEHPFLSVNVGTKVADLIKRLGRGAEPDRLTLSASEKYAQAVLFAASEFVGTIDQMKYATASLAGYRKRDPRGSRFAPTRLDHLTYHLENHIIRTVMLTDRALQLTNVVFSLGLPERECSESTVVKNSHVSNTAAGMVLRSLLKFVAPVRQQRNVIIHRHRHQEHRFDRFAKFFILEQFEQGADPANRVTPKYEWFFRTLTNKYVEERKGELTAQNVAAEDIGEALFDALQSVFDHEWQIRNRLTCHSS